MRDTHIRLASKMRNNHRYSKNCKIIVISLHQKNQLHSNRTVFFVMNNTACEGDETIRGSQTTVQYYEKFKNGARK